MAVVVQPMAPQAPEEDAVPVVDMGEYRTQQKDKFLNSMTGGYELQGFLHAESANT